MSLKKWLVGFAIISVVLYIVFEGEEAYENSSFGIAAKEYEAKNNLEERDGTHFACAPHWRGGHKYTYRGETTQLFTQWNESVESNDAWHDIESSITFVNGKRADDEWYKSKGKKIPVSDRYKRAGDDFLITLYPPDKFKIHHRASWYKYSSGDIKSKIDHHFITLKNKNQVGNLRELKGSDGEFYELHKDKGSEFIFNRINFMIGEKGLGAKYAIDTDIWACVIIDADTLKALIKEREDRLVLDQKVIKEKEKELRSRSKI